MDVSETTDGLLVDWHVIEPAWQLCLDQAWLGYSAGSYPIGAVITDATGEVLGRGRSRRFESATEPTILAGNALAHAEINAILSVADADVDLYGATLYVTTEPCPLCVGAICMAGLRRFVYALSDPWSGSADLVQSGRFLGSRQIEAIKADDYDVERFVAILSCHRWLTITQPAVWELQRFTKRGAAQRIEIAGQQYAPVMEETRRCLAFLSGALEQRLPVARVYQAVRELLSQPADPVACGG